METLIGILTAAIVLGVCSFSWWVEWMFGKDDLGGFYP